MHKKKGDRLLPYALLLPAGVLMAALVLLGSSSRAFNPDSGAFCVGVYHFCYARV